MTASPRPQGEKEGTCVGQAWGRSKGASSMFKSPLRSLSTYALSTYYAPEPGETYNSSHPVWLRPWPTRWPGSRSRVGHHPHPRLGQAEVLLSWDGPGASEGGPGSVEGALGGLEH